MQNRLRYQYPLVISALPTAFLLMMILLKTMHPRNIRILRLLVIFLTLFFVSFRLSSVSISQNTPILVKIEYQTEDQLPVINDLGVQLIGYVGDEKAEMSAAVGLIEQGQINVLSEEGFKTSILDPQPELEKYYLIYLRNKDQKDKLFSHGEVFFLTPHNYLLKTTPAEATKVLTYGFSIAKLSHAVEPPPSVRASAPPLCGQHQSNIQNLVNSVSQNNLEIHLKNLQSLQVFDPIQNPNYDDQQTRWSSYQGNKDEAAYIHNHFLNLGLNPSYQSFPLTGGIQSNNVIATLPGQDPNSDQEFLLVAHMDSTAQKSGTNNPAPGADDNASGTAVVMEAARILSQSQLKHTLKFIAFSGEEQGLLGSDYYATRAKQNNDNIQGVINLDMIGNDSGDDYLIGLSNSSSAWLRKCLIDNNSLYQIGLKACEGSSSACNSDHCPFWYQGFPAIFGHEEGCGGQFSPVYHSTKDTFEYIRSSQVAKVAQLAVATMAQLGEPLSVTPTPTLSITPSLSPPPPTSSPPLISLTTTPTLTPGCPNADVNGDGQVNQNDLDSVLSNYLKLPPHTCAPPNAPKCQLDTNNDAVINTIEAIFIASCWTG